MPVRISLWKLTDFEKAAGAETFARTLSCFSCPLNRDVEDYLKNPKRETNASHMSSSVTYLVLDRFHNVRKEIGGKLVMVEHETNRPKLMEFYNRNGFKSWTRRFDEKSKVEFDQMFAVLNDEPLGGPGS